MTQMTDMYRGAGTATQNSRKLIKKGASDMIRYKLFSSLFAFGAILLLVPPADAARLYKWVDQHGIVHYSDKLPPENSKKAHQELNKRGITTRDIDQAKSSQQTEAEKLAAAAEQEKRRQQAEQSARKRMRDKVLLDTFTTERDLILARDERLSAILSVVNLAKSNEQRLQKQIAKTKENVAALQKRDATPPPELDEQLTELNTQLQKAQSFISSKHDEHDDVAEQFNSDMQRYRELKGISPPATANGEEEVPKDQNADTQESTKTGAIATTSELELPEKN